MDNNSEIQCVSPEKKKYLGPFLGSQASKVISERSEAEEVTTKKSGTRNSSPKSKDRRNQSVDDFKITTI